MRSKDNKKLQQRVGRNNIGNGYYTIHDFVGDFRVKKYLDDWRDTDLYRVYLDSGKAINMIDDIVDVLNDIDEVNIEFINKNSIDFTFKNLTECLTESLDIDQFINLFLDALSVIFLFSQRKNIKKALGYKENESIIKTLIMNVKKALEEMNDNSTIN